MWLVNSSVAVNIEHILQPAAQQGRLSDSSWLVTVRDAPTKRSLKFLGQRKAINGGSGTALHSRSEVWKWQSWKVGKVGWYVTTSCSRADFSWLGCICKHFFREIVSARGISLIAAHNTPALVDVSWVRGSTSENAHPPNKFIWGEALECKGLRICSVVDGSYPFGVGLTCRSVPIWPSLR